MNLKWGNTEACMLAVLALAAQMALAKLYLLDVALMPIWQFLKPPASFAQ